ncbi:uncharacterized protein KD926_009124 [Aspergillus affinis]|uniref:uncharacterized protein n=1 Tax=Aspergillus affinis TaxID=1070780 RepID=UPI0022FDBE0A|nr:uncharacterized protein KD926_009124 [Aspergillus affinis]KAI9039781.1 hypothetical protein KD926_009124 [Aspergillus affinis]
MVRALGPRKIQNGSSRQRPVSCQFCRARKLKCNRQLPCGNCTSRGIFCQLYSQPPTDESVTDQDVLERLRRLEELVLRSHGQIPTPTPPVIDVVTQAPYSVPQFHQASTEVKRLEQECMSQDRSVSGWLYYGEEWTVDLEAQEMIQPDGVTFRIYPIEHRGSMSGDLSRDTSWSNAMGSSQGFFCLPRSDEARRLLDKNIRDVTYIHHVIHVPSVRALVDGIYEDVDNRKQPKPHHVVLLYGIIASSIYLWTEQDMDLPFCRNGKQATEKSALWVKSALDLLDYLRRASSQSMEEIQGIIIASFVVCHLEGPSARYRDLITSAITMARELGLHRIDIPNDADATDECSRDPLEAEVGRRVWWYLVSTDWMFSQYTGPFKGTYTINPRHMAVNKPRNVDDEDLLPGLASTTITPRPMNHSTNISYNLQRIQLAEICRELTDSTPLTSSGTVEYSQVLKFDRSIIGFIAQWPPFFRLDEDITPSRSRGRARTRTKDTKDPGKATQRYILNSIVPAQRCRLHLPYLTRASLDPNYAYSRDACLESARHILRTERLLATEDLPFVLMRKRHSGTLQCICMAIIALLADICFCRDMGGSEEHRRAELADACQILDRAKTESPMARRLLGYFMRVMREHNLRLPDVSQGGGEERTGTGVGRDTDTTRESVAMGSMGMMDEETDTLDLPDQLARWQEFWPGNGMDTELDWDAILSGLNPLI